MSTWPPQPSPPPGAPHPPGAPGPPGAADAATGGPGVGAIAVAAAGLLLVSVLFLAAVVVMRAGAAEPTAGDAMAGMAGAAEDTTAPAVPADGRVAAAPPEPPFDDRFAYIATRDDGGPVTWSPCAPVRYVVDPRTEPPEGRAALDASLAMVEELTGLDFVFEGEVDEPAPGPAARSRRAADGWAPVLISWTDPTEVPDLSDALGITQNQESTGSDGQHVWVSGWIELDGSAMGELTHDRLMRTIVHEVGHLVGLAHVSDPGQIMFDTATDNLTVGAGDRTGFYEVGTGPCVETDP